MYHPNKEVQCHVQCNVHSVHINNRLALDRIRSFSRSGLVHRCTVTHLTNAVAGSHCGGHWRVQAGTYNVTSNLMTLLDITCEKAFLVSPVAMTDSSPGKTIPLYALAFAFQ